MMQLLDLSLPSPEENLALDEALLELAEDGLGSELLRFWETAQPCVILGYSNKTLAETQKEACKADRVPILRRPSGGGTVLQGPGCLNYALILAIPETGPLTSLVETNTYILTKNQQALAPFISGEIRIQGISDLTLGGLKFSGNAQRRKRHHLLFHGTFLYNFSIPLIEKYLREPSLQPDYRHKRRHLDFLTNIPIPPELIKRALKETWQATENPVEIPSHKMRALMEEKYFQKSWNEKF